MGKKESLDTKPKDTFFDDVKPIGNPLIPATNSVKTQKELGITSTDKEDYGKISEGENVNKLRVDNQSVLEQGGSFLTQAAGEVVGGAISGIGATLDIPDAIISEVRDKDADFKNLITDAGDAITQWSKDAAPIYRQNPGKAFDVTDSGWWFENGVSIASTLSLLIPATGAVKGLSYVSKLVGLADELALANKLGKSAKWAANLEKSKYFAKIGTSAIVSRNAENFKESAQVLNDTKSDLLKEWDENPDKFNELANSEVAKELQAEGRPVDKENLANFIASKAAWLSYGVNSLNIGFDALQLAPLFKGFKPVTQISKLETSAVIKKAQKEALGKTFSKMDYLASSLNPLSSTFARNATEGLEEAINYVGTEEGKAYADQLANKKTKDLSGRIGDYLVDPKMYESAVWGVLGGMAFGGAANGLGRVANLVKGKDGYGLKEARVDEINKRVSQIRETSEAIKQIENDPKLNDEEKSHYIANVKADAITKLTINAAQVGNYKMLVEHLSSPEMKKEMLANGYAKEEDVDKAITKSLLDAQTAVEMYKTNYNLFQTRNIDENTKNIQIAEKTYWDSVGNKHLEQRNKLTKDIQILKAKDNYINTTTDKNVDLTIQLTALKNARKSISNITENANEPLSEYQKEILATTDNRIAELESNITEKANLTTLNAQIIDKQTQVEQKNMIIEALGHKAKYMTTPAFSQKIKQETEKATKERKDKDINDFKESIKDKSKNELETLKSTIKDKVKKDIIDSNIKDLNKKEDLIKRKTDVTKAKETVAPAQNTETQQPISNTVSNPVKTRTGDEIFDMFDEDFETKKIDETKLDAQKKQLIDNALNTKDYGSLLRADSAYRGGVEQQYIRNKITEIKEGLLKVANEAQIVANLNEVPVSNNIDDNIDETNLFKLERPQSTEVNKKDNNGLLFAKKTTGSNNQESVRPLLDIFKLIGYNGEEQITEDEKGNLRTSKETEEAIKVAYDLKPGDTVTLKIDPTNALYERYKEDNDRVPIGIYKNNVRIGYIAQRTRSINENEFDMLSQFREHIKLDLNKTLDVEITEKTNGDVINTKEWYSIKNMNLDKYEFYTVLNSSSGHELERLSPDAAYHINEKRPYGKVVNTPEGKKNLRGVLYLMLHNVNGAPFPTPLSISKLSDFDAAKVENNINNLLTLLDSGKGLETQEVQKIKDSIAEYILVDDSRDVKREQDLEKTKREAYLKFEKAETEEGKAKYAELKADYDELQSKRKINFRVHAPSKSKPARIEMSYIAGDGTKRLVILNKDSINIKGQNGEALAYKKAINGDFGKLFADQDKDSVLGKILKSKYYNVNFKKLREGNQEYKEKLIYNNVLRTNVGEITDNKGNVLSNFTNFSIRITNKQVEEKVADVTTEVKEEKTNSKDNQELFGDLFNIKREAKELFFRDAKTNYRLYANNKSTANELIEDILKNPKSDLIKKAAEFLKNDINNVNIEFKDIKERDTVAVYDSLNNKINVTDRNRFNSETEFQESMLHEITHALTVLPLVKFKEFLGTKIAPDLTSYKFKDSASKDLVTFVTKMETLRQDAINTINKKYPDVDTRKFEQTYGLTNVYEFISEVFVNENFREAIKEDRNLFERILDSILEFLNSYLGTKKRDNNVDLATKEIIKFINSQKKENYNKIDGISPIASSVYLEFKKKTNKVSDNFSSEEKNHLINFTKTATLHYFKGGKLEDTNSKIEQSTSKSFVKSKIQLVLDKAVLNDNQKELLERSIEHFDTLWVETLSQVNRVFGTKIDENENDNLDTTETLELEKKWDDSAANATAMNEQLSKEVKWFIATTPQKDKQGNTIQNPVTGLPESVNYGSVINLMIKHLSSAQTELDLLNKLETLKVVNPSFELMVSKLKNDANLLAAFKSQFTRNILDSNILLISKMDEYIKAKVDNEFKKTKGYINIADNWIKIVNNNIDNSTYKTKTFKDSLININKDKLQFEKLRLEENYLSKDNRLTEKGNELVNLLLNYSNLLGINLDIPAIEDSVKSARILNDVVILNKLDNITRTIEKDEKNNSNGDLNDIAKFQDKYDIEFAEIMALNLKGEPVYAAQLPSFLTNFFARLKSDNKEVREKFEKEFFEIVENDPVMQYSNWAWTEGTKLGLFNYVIVGNKKQPTSINKDYVSMWGIAKLGGAKNTISKEVKEYSDASENDYNLMLAYMYLDNGKNKHCWIPTLIPSDSGNLPLLKVNRFQLKDKELSFTLNGFKASNVQLSENSDIFKAVQNATFQEIERMKQAYDLMFDVTQESIKIKAKYYNEETNSLTEEGKQWFSLLEKNYHYKKIAYKKGTNEVDVQNTLLDKSGKPSGRVFEFHNLRIGDKTLSNKEAFKNPYNLVGTISASFIANNINPFIQQYVANLINTELTTYNDIKNEGLIKKEVHEHIGDGSFEQFIAEMALNNYIHNVEQQVWFNGVSAQYKNNVDTNKRAKQMNAPGNAPTTAGATEYGAITIQDVTLKSKTFDTIKAQVEKQLLEEKGFKYKDNKELLDADVNFIIKDYNEINSGDAQGYITVKGLKELYEKYGMMNDTFIKIFKQIESGEQLNTQAIKTLQAVKPFHYGIGYNHVLNKMTPNQIKLSYLPLIPQLIAGTDLEKIANHLDKVGATRLFFESAHKVGATQIYKLHNEDGKLNTDFLEAAKPVFYKYSDEQIQLTVPDHLVDSTNLLATQIAKLIVANLSEKPIYNGKTGKEIKEQYFNILVKNIEESKDTLLSDIKITKDEDGNYKFEDSKALRDVLLEEIASRGLGKNYEDTIALKENGEFVLPLFTGKNADKWESILTSLFTNRIMKQKLPGASLTLASDLFIKQTTQADSKIKGIEWQEGHNGELKSYTINEENKEVQVVEVVMGSWSKKFFKDGQRISIDKIPVDVRTMVGYRIPTQAKHSMVVFKVVGLLPEEAKGSIIMPNDIITQMGSDFDIDKLFVMYKNFTNDFSTKITESSLHYIKKLKKDLANIEKIKEDSVKKEQYTNLMKLFSQFLEETGEVSIEETEVFANLEIEEKIKKIESLRPIFEKQDRQNDLIDIYKTILTNTEHLKESFTPATFVDFIEGKKILDKLFETSDDNIDILSSEGQRTFRKRNMAGRVLKGIAANFNSFLPVAQNTGMSLKSNLGFKQKVRIKNSPVNEYEKVYDLTRLQEKYKDVIVDGDYAIVTLTKIGKSDNDSYLNIDDNIITEVASQGIGAAVDIVKDPTFDAFNATIYTYPQFNTALAVGANPMYMMFFTRQPIVKMLNDEYFNGKSLLGNNTGQERTYVRNVYETLLYNALVEKKKIKGKVVKNIKSSPKRFNKEMRSKLFSYSLEDIKTFSDGELYKMLEQNKIGHSKLELDERIEYYKNQLYILNQFAKNYEAGEAVQDVLKSVKTDGHGAGPSMEKTVDLSNLIFKSSKAEKVLINDKSAVNSIYPKLFGSKEKSAYPVIEAYYDNVNELSYKVLSPLFITQNNSFVQFKSELKYNSIDVKNNMKVLKKFFNKALLEDFKLFNEDEKHRVLGTSIYRENKPKFDGSIDSFKQLSTLDKLSVIKEITSSETVKGQSNILNRLIPNDKFEALGYSKIDFNSNYKDTMLDDMFAEQLETFYNSGDEFKKEFIIDLLKYNYFANGMEFGFGSISKVFPPNVLVKEGIGEHLYSKNTSDSLFNTNLDYFYRNNWTNGNIVPKVKTKHERVNGEKVVEQDEDGLDLEENGKPVYKTYNNTPVWDANSNVLLVDYKKLKNEAKNVKNSPYLVINKTTKEGTNYINTPYLFKRVELEINEEDKNILIYYYKVNPLGKDGIIEFSDKSIWLENNLVNEDKNYQDVMDKILEIENNKSGLPNISQEDIDNHTKECGGL